MMSNIEHKSRRTTLMPVTIMEEVQYLRLKSAPNSSHLSKKRKRVLRRAISSSMIPRASKIGSLLYFEMERHDLPLVRRTTRTAREIKSSSNTCVLIVKTSPKNDSRVSHLR